MPRPAISSHSLGRAWVHNLESKLDQAARYGFEGIEMFWEDLQYVARSLPGGPTSDNHLEAARVIRSMCDKRSIEVVCLQPFMHYEGLRDRQRHLEKLDEMRLWIQIANTLRTSIISVPSTRLPESETSGDMELIVQDLREVADLAAPAGIQIAYEALAWGTYIDRWDQAWDVVEKVDRSNFGICLDTFNIAARVYADPTTPTRKNPNAEAEIRKSLEKLVRTVNPKKVAYVQVVDAEYLPEPLEEGHEIYDPSQHPRMSWSRNCRLFYGEADKGAYLPVKAILKAVLQDIGFDGWISAELFNASLTDSSSTVPEQHAQRAAEGWHKIVEDFRIKVQLTKPQAGPTSSVRAERLSRAQL